MLKIVNGAGAEITSDPIVKTSYGFTNREYDVESGMMYYRARFYSPVIGRFISEDPHPGEIYRPITNITKYVYSLNNSINNIDPFGDFIPDTHGNYCGNQNNQAFQGSFRYRNYDEYGNGVGDPYKPVDSLDEACMYHDGRYATLNDWLEFGNYQKTWEQSRSEFTIAKRGVDHALTSLARGDIEGIVSGTAHFAFGAVTGVWSGIRTGIGAGIDIAKNILDAIGIKF